MQEIQIVACPHCGGGIEIEAINCAIFRHGVYKTGEAIPPHSSKEECDKAIDQGIYGCGKPFRCEMQNNIYVATICDYI